MYTVKLEILAGKKFHWLTNPKVFVNLIFTNQWQFPSISLVKWNLSVFNFHGFASSAKIAKINQWNFLVFQDSFLY